MRNPNLAQRIAVASGAILLLVAVLFPPVISLTTGKNPLVEMKGYAFLFLMSGISGSIYFPLLLTELGVITILAIAAFFLLKGDRKQPVPREHGFVSRARERIKASVSAIVQRLRGATRTSAGVAVTWAVVALLIAAECVFPVTKVPYTGAVPWEYEKIETGLPDVSEFVMIFGSNHRPVWLSDPSDILWGRIAFEIVALLLAGVAVSILLTNKKSVRKVRTVWAIGMLLLANLCIFPPMRVYDSRATSRIVESRRAQKMQALEKLMKEQKTKTLVRHTIGKGETVWEIAEQYGISIQALVDANNLSKEKGLTVGQTLLIPVPNEFRISDSVGQSMGQNTQSREASDRENEAKILRILSPSEVVYRNIHTPVWTSGQEEIRHHQLALEMLAILLVSVGGTFFMRKKGNN